MAPESLSRVGMVARWQPVHLGQAPVLRGLCACAAHAVIGIGSANRHDLRTPFSVHETQRMIELVLAGYDPGSYTVVAIPDLDDGPRWRTLVAGLLGPLDCFFTDNPYVASLLTGCYRVARPVTLVAEQDRVPIDGTMVRRAMAEGEGWQELVPAEVMHYLVAEGLDRRFRRQFGLQTLALPVTQPKTEMAVPTQPVLGRR